jgi:hypothetical protein
MTDDIPLPPLPLPNHAGPHGTGTYFSAWSEKQMREAQCAAVLLDRQQRSPSAEPVLWQWRRKSDAWSLQYTFNSDVVATTDDSEVRPLYAAPPAPSAEPVNLNDPAIQKRLAAQWGYVPAPSAAPVKVYNPWRESLENCINGDNYLRATEYLSLIEELDDLYRFRAAAPPAPSAEPAAFRYLYSDGFWRFSNGSRVNGSDPVEAQPLYTTPPDHLAVMRQALEALEERYVGALRDNAIDALRAALERKR